MRVAFSSTYCSARILLLAVLSLLFPGDANAGRGPQDNWGRGREVCCAGELIYAHDFDRLGNLFVVTNRLGGRLIKLDRRFQEVAATPVTPFGQVRTDSAGNVYVTEGSVIRRFDNGLSQTGSVSFPSDIIYEFEVLNDGGYAVWFNRLKIYDSSGVFVRNVGASSCMAVLDSICDLSDMDIYPSGEIVVHQSRNNGVLQWLSVFDVGGNLLGRTEYIANTGGGVTLLPGNSVMVIAQGPRLIQFEDPRKSVAQLSEIALPFVLGGAVRASPSGDLVISDGRSLVHMPAGFRSLGARFGASPLPERDAIPQPAITTIARRPSSTIIDLSFRVADEDDASVDARVVALRDGLLAIDKIVPMTALVDGTAANIGPGTPTGATRTVSWDAAVDLGTAQPTVNLDFQVLARDARGLIDLDFVGIPAGIPLAADPALVISRSPIFANELLEAWLWLIATNDSRIVLQNGEVRGNGGSHHGLLLASGTTTTPDGRSFLFGLLGIREATAAEITRAREGSTPGSVNQFSARNGMPYLQRPSAVNQFGIDTGAQAGFWVVLP